MTTKYSNAELSPSTHHKRESHSASQTEYLKYMRLLTSLSNCANVSVNETLEDLFEMTKKKILENHKFKIYFSESENCYRTYLPDESSPHKRRPIKRKSRTELEKEIVHFYEARQLYIDRSQITLEELFKEWMIYRRDYTSAKPKTIQENFYDWKYMIEGTDLAKTPVKEITTLTLIRFFRKVTKNRTETYKRVSNVRSVLNGIMSYAIEEQLISTNPVSGVEFKKFTYKPVEDQSRNVFTQEETQALLKYLQSIDEPYSLAIQLSFYLFIRIGETKGIQIKDIDLEKGTIYLHDQVLTERYLNDDMTFSKRTVEVSDSMKGNTSHGYRTQYLTDQAIEIIQKAIKLNPNGRFLFEPNGKPMTTDRFNRRLKKYCEECGIPYHSSHKIRFYNASTAFNGENLTTISRLMGHSQVQTTLHYLRSVRSEENDRQAFKNLGLSG